MNELVLAKREVICKRCDTPTMKPAEPPVPFRFTGGEAIKVLVKCQTCGRPSYIIRSVN